jgi:MFS family permease
MPPRAAEHLESLKDPLLSSRSNVVAEQDEDERAEEPVLRLLSLRRDSSLRTTTSSNHEDDNDKLQDCQPTSPTSSTNSGNQTTNVKYIMMYTLFAFAGRSIWSQSVLSLFVSLLRNDNPEAVGYITAVMGIAQLVASFPAGILADMYSRATILKCASVSGMLAVSATLMACWYGRYTSLMMALLCWGITYGIADTLLIALLADSVPDGERSYYFTKRQMLLTLGNVSGPLVALSMFAFLGNTWTIRDCSLVMAVAQVICVPAVIILCFFRDVLSLFTRKAICYKKMKMIKTMTRSTE